MKPTWLTKNRRGRRTSPRLSLFPFLAVLICTMGALVLLLLAVTRQARLQAVHTASAKVAQRHADLKTDRETIVWRTEQLKKSRQETESQLAEARLVLGHIEDHSRRLRQKLDQLLATAKNLDASQSETLRARSVKKEELDQVRGRLSEAQQRLVETQQAVQKRPRSYAVIPYEGPNQTRRRPIYLECRADCVVLQPENITFFETDFDGPQGPGNPLAAALRAAREYLLVQGTIDPQNGGEPYPLLLVRPSGISAYYAARAAMKSWASEFGYELIGDDWPLKFPPPDAGLANVVQQAAAAARVQQERLIAAAPSRYGKRPKTGNYRDASGGGGGGDREADEGSGFYSPRPPAARYGGRYGDSGTGGPSAVAGAGGGYGGTGSSGGRGTVGGVSGGASGTGGSSVASVYGGAALAATPGGNGIPGGVAGNGILGNGIPGNGIPGGGTSGSGVAGGISGNGVPGSGNVGNGVPGYGMSGGGISGNGTTGNGIAGNSTSGGGVPGNGIAGSGGSDGIPGSNNSGGGGAAAGSIPGGPSSGSAAGPMAGNPATAGSTGDTPSGPTDAANRIAMARPEGYVAGRPPGDPAPDRGPSPQDREPASTTRQLATPLRPGEWRPREEFAPPPKRDEDRDDKKQPKRAKSLADKRGEDWGLRDAARGSIAVTRPIRVECYPDQLVLVPEPGTGSPKAIPMTANTERSIDKMISAVWEHMDSWGMAGRGMYWRPILNVAVAPGAETRFEELDSLLRGSGLTVQRK